MNSSGILIVDDNPTNLQVLSDSLLNEGFQVAVAIDGESAIEQVSYHRPELILLDIMMPGIDGFETCRRLQKDSETKDIPIIFMTALSDIENKISGLSLGAVDYITKPFQQEEVLARIKIHLKLQNMACTLHEQNDRLKQEIIRREQVETELIHAKSNLEKLNDSLEEKVKERTQELSSALEELQNTQLQLVQQEKLSALGQLVAGIAHEINNPVNFICGNVAFASKYTHSLLNLFKVYAKHHPQPHPEVQDTIDEIDLDFLAEDLPKLLGSIEMGTDRIRNIVLGLKIFSRLDEAEFKNVNIHEGIDSTLLILNSRLKKQKNRPEIQIEKIYGDLPPIKCYPGQLNQVFMNILSNAIDALEERVVSEDPVRYTPNIKIQTEVVDSDLLLIQFSDNGTGIPIDTQQKIFDPFFTTKPVGKGTGLGMSISHQIITENHYGSLECISHVGRGTDFIIAIPLKTLRSQKYPKSTLKVKMKQGCRSTVRSAVSKSLINTNPA